MRGGGGDTGHLGRDSPHHAHLSPPLLSGVSSSGTSCSSSTPGHPSGLTRTLDPAHVVTVSTLVVCLKTP